MATKRVTATPALLEAALRSVDWQAQDALTDADIDAQIAEDPDAAPDMSDRFLRSAAFVQRVRRKTGLSQTAFAARYRIPVRTLQEWEQGRREPEATVLAYLTVIEREPDMVGRALTPA
ncbi:MAG: helix-turn-helix domain-containing protein [Paracraurococcus sp.]